MATGSAAVPAGIGQVNRCFKPRYKPLVRIGCGCNQRSECRCVVQQTSDVPQPKLAEPRVEVAREQRLAIFPQALVRMHTGAVVLEYRLGHEGNSLAVLAGNVADDVLVNHHAVGGLQHGIEFLIDFALTASCHFMVVALNGQPRFSIASIISDRKS